MRNRDFDGNALFVLRMAAAVGGNRSTPILFLGFSIMGLPWHLGVRWTRRMVLCLNPGFRQGLDILFGPRTANRSNEAGSDGGISNVADVRCVLHIQEIDTPTLSTEFR